MLPGSWAAVRQEGAGLRGGRLFPRALVFNATHVPRQGQRGEMILPRGKTGAKESP